MVATPTEQRWLDDARALILRGQMQPAQAIIDQTLAEYPESTALQRAQAAVYQQAGRVQEAEALLRMLLERDAGDAASAFTLAW